MSLENEEIDFLAAQNEILQEKDDEAFIRVTNNILKRKGSEKRLSAGQGVTARKFVEEVARQYGYDMEYLAAATLLFGRHYIDARPQYSKDVERVYNEKYTFGFVGASSVSKCLGPNVEVLLYGGGTKKAKDIVVGDVLIGDDGKPRNVTHTTSGRSKMYRVVPHNGVPWECNKDHILTLRCNHDKICGGSGKVSRVRFKGNVKDFPIEEYMSMSKSCMSSWKQFHVPVEYRKRDLPFDPYVYGAWIGDGGFGVPVLHTPDCEMSRYWCSYFESIGYRIHIRETDRDCREFYVRCRPDCRTNGDYKTISINNQFTDFIRTSRTDVHGEKKILEDYMYSSREDRLKLLAGIIDSDGHTNHCGYTITTKWENLARQIHSLARGLGMRANVYSFRAKFNKDAEEGIYWHCQLSGNGTKDIPCLDKSVKGSAHPSKVQTNDGIKDIIDLGEGEYYGFSVDGNHRFLLGDYTVTHNSYSMGIILLVDYWLDPEGTQILVGSLSQQHLEGNLFSAMVDCVEKCAIDMGLECSLNSRWIRRKSLEKDEQKKMDYVIRGQLFPKDSTKSVGALRGYKPKPRGRPHPIFGTHTRVRVFIDESCFDDKTDVLTKDGWKNWSDVTEEDLLLTMDQNTHEAFYAKPSAIVRQHYKGPMHRYSAKGLDYAVTPNHKMYYGQWYTGECKITGWHFKQMKEMKTWNNRLFKKDIEWNVDDAPISDDWFRFYGWFLSEGSLPKRGCEIVITQNQEKNPKNYEEICGICERLGLKPKRYKNQVHILHHELAAELHKTGRTCLIKRVPEFIRMASKRQINIFLDAFLKGDGYVQNKRSKHPRGIFYTSSPQMANDLQECILKTGVPSVVSKREIAGQVKVFPDGHTATSSVDGYVVTRPSIKTWGRPMNRNSWVEEYDGMIYCAEIPETHLLFTRRNGYTMWSGNSNVSGGVFKDFESPLMSVGKIPDGKGGFTKYDAVKIGFALNPTDADHASARYVEPEDGLDSIDIDTDYEWLSKKGFHILRLDGAKSENVRAKKIVFFGIQSYEAHLKLMRNGGESAEYMCYGRGWYAKRGSFSAVIPLDNIIKQRGQLIFPAGSENVASVDVAFVQDKCIFTLGRWGMASGVVRPGNHRETFMLDGVPTTRPCIQIDQQFEIFVTSDTVKLVKEIMRLCTDFKVKPEWLAIDRTAIGKGSYDLLCNFFGGVLGINWQEAATEMKVLADDVDTAHDKFVNISSEMWFATAAWLEHGFLWLSEDVPSQPLYAQLSTRRKLPGRQGRMKVETKPDYTSRAGGGKSPDESDSLIMICHLCRMRGEWLPSASGKEASGLGPVAEIDLKDLQDNVDSGDSLCDFEEKLEEEVQFTDFWNEKN